MGRTKYQMYYQSRAHVLEQALAIYLKDKPLPVEFFDYHGQGRGNDFYLGGARLIRKMRFCYFQNFYFINPKF